MLPNFMLVVYCVCCVCCVCCEWYPECGIQDDKRVPDEEAANTNAAVVPGGSGIRYVGNTKIHEFYIYPTPNFMNLV